MKIIVDAMGGDNAPLEIVKGALQGRARWGVDIVLTRFLNTIPVREYPVKAENRQKRRRH